MQRLPSRSSLKAGHIRDIWPAAHFPWSCTAIRQSVSTVRTALVDWLNDMHLIQAGRAAVLDRYIGYYEPYATSHEALDRDKALQEEVRNAARTLANEIELIRKGRLEPDDRIEDPRPK